MGENTGEDSNSKLIGSLCGVGVISVALIGYCVFARRQAKKMTTEDFQRA